MRFTIKEIGEYFATGKGSRELIRAIHSNTHIMTFFAERKNRPPRFKALINDYKAGVKLKDIAAKWGCSETTVYNYLRAAGLKANRYPVNGARR